MIYDICSPDKIWIVNLSVMRHYPFFIWIILNVGVAHAHCIYRHAGFISGLFDEDHELILSMNLDAKLMSLLREPL